MLGVESGQGTTQFIHSLQCALGNEALILLPYIFSTGCTGHKEEHQALFHSKNKLMPNPVNAITVISIAVAIPLLLNKACLKGTMAYKSITDTRLSCASRFADNIFLREMPSFLGSNVVVASGQIFLHNPTATTISAGATGINMFQNNKRPVDGKKMRQMKINAPTAQTRN